MEETESAVIFFDLGDTLGTPIISPPPLHIIGFDVFDHTPSVLQRLSSQGLRLGVISNTGEDSGVVINQVLDAAGILTFFDADLLIYSADVGQTKSSPSIFLLAAERAGLADARRRCLYVGEDAAERRVALDAGLRVVPHPLLVQEVLDNEPLRYVRITAPIGSTDASWREALRGTALLPLHVTGSQGNVVYAITSQRWIPSLINMRFAVDLLGEPDDPLRTELYLLRDDAAVASGALSTEGESARLFTDESDARLAISSTGEELIVALPPTRSLDDLHFRRALHGHTIKLVPNPLLLEPLSIGGLRHAPGLVPAARRDPPILKLSDDDAQQLANISGPRILDRVERYSGKRPVSSDSEDLISSRHILHSGNGLGVAALARELQTIGQNRLKVRLSRFTHAGITLHNVEAELPGISPDLVLITAHLDSTAALSMPYDAVHDAAPGADDDASGVAAVMTIAEQFVAMSNSAPLPRTVRFVLFNAEEHGLVGSEVYARHQRALQAPIVAVFQLDMIGYNKQPPRSWEVHAGFSAVAEVEDRSVALAEIVRQVAPQVSPQIEIPQLYHSGSLPEGDRAEGRSDHTSFQACGYTACLVSEDFFAGPWPATSDAEANPNYHSRNDTVIDEAFAADIARAVAGAACMLAKVDPTSSPATPLSHAEVPMPTHRELDSRKFSSTVRAAAPPAALISEGPSTRNRMTATPQTVRTRTQPPTGQSLVDKALAFVQSERTSFGFGPDDVAEFVPDPVAQITSSGSAAVHLHQEYRGVPVFEMARTVRFDPDSQVSDALGDNVPMPEGFSTESVLAVTEAVRRAAQHLTTTSTGESLVDAFGESYSLPGIDADGFQPQIVAGFTLPSRPTVIDKGPFENLIPAHLVVFYRPDGPRLGWHTVLTLPDYADQYVVIVAADEESGEILYSKSTVHRVLAKGNVFEFSPGIADRRMVDFPRPLSDYPSMPTAPLAGFPRDWVADDKAIGNATRATLNTGGTTLTGVTSDGVVVFDPSDPSGDDQKLLNIFYFCNYMHDFLFILGFDEAAGNFQQTNFMNTGLGNDPVRARAHSGPVVGTANMATGPDGLPPLMNMGLVSSTGRHTAVDGDVVMHEFAHGLTSRLAGGPLDLTSLRKLQSAGMNEGWADYFPLTIQNFFRTQEKVVMGDWVVGNAAGIRRAPYDDDYPFKYGDLKDVPINPGTGLPGVHGIGEVWCAALMMATRRIRAAVGDDRTGYQLAWQIVVDGLKLSPANPTFIQARDAILRALDDLKLRGRISASTHKDVRRAAWQAFAHFGIGVNALSDDADDVDAIVADSTLPSSL